MEWAVAVTACPRSPETLPQTLQSLMVAGWDQYTVHCEPGTKLSGHYCKAQWNQRTKGAWGNFLVAVRSLSKQKADAYLILQDDAVLSSGLRGWLDRVLWPAGQQEIGVLSLYASENKQAAHVGWHVALPRKGYVRIKNEIVDTMVVNIVGAPAYVFPRHMIERLADDPPTPDELHQTDYRICKFCMHRNLKVILPNPSLARHIGEKSAIYPGREFGPDRREREFCRRASSLDKWEGIVGYV